MDHIKEINEKFNIEGLIVFEPYDVYNLLVSALEGGSNYWYWLGEKSMDRVFEATRDMEDESTVVRIMMAIQRGTTVNVFDVENQDKLGKLTKDSWAKAEQLMMKQQRRHFADVLAENDDATTGDVFFQLAVMGELVYG